MAKIKMTVTNDITFYEGCEEYILDCKARNLRNGTLRHYTDSSKQIMKYIGEDTEYSCTSKSQIWKIGNQSSGTRKSAYLWLIICSFL